MYFIGELVKRVNWSLQKHTKKWKNRTSISQQPLNNNF
jgi:hypothetical protein